MINALLAFLLVLAGSALNTAVGLYLIRRFVRSRSRQAIVDDLEETDVRGWKELRRR